ncbi:carbohydrate ABC transporter membrane protein 1 (CUT1 family) [Humitalea rosea]|uniref:Carbohydrate ABC transporter membrane protein 1 (CUT1 family) n=1 Tax=Humitalea rosea TaxID=990373 RepID=A0A2W7IW84_9PROT|nr:sugar ABC transporter permease [Humitalea rosea]PZW50527.1 carbohydrate ABC transporter membrane protein 1 (CUT1 family) [Humitalea rosea]
MSERAGFGEALAGWLLTGPAILAYLAMLLIPTLAVVVLAFTDFELGMPGFHWVGLDNFSELLTDHGMRTSVRNTALYVALVTPASILAGLGLALLIEAGSRGKVFFRAVFFLPVVSLMVAMATAWQYLLHPTIGPVNAWLALFGIAGPNWLGSSDWVLVSLGLIGVWENAGFNMVLVLAGLTAIPRELYAAAEVDGAAGPWARFRLVTWPLLGPTMLLVTTITTIRAIRTFDSIATLTQGGPNKASEMIVWTIYQEGFSYLRMGYAAALTVVFLVVVLAIMLVQTRLIEKRTHYS